MMASSDRKTRAGGRDKRLIYRLSDSRQHLVGPSRPTGPWTAVCRPPPHLGLPAVDPMPVHSHLPELVDHDPAGQPGHHHQHQAAGECAGFVAAGSWAASAARPETTPAGHPGRDATLGEYHHPILSAIIEDALPLPAGSAGHEGSRDASAVRAPRSYSNSPSVLELIPELQKPQSHYFINTCSTSSSSSSNISSASLGHGSSSSVGSSGWPAYGFDWSLPSSEQWSGHLKSVLLDVLTPASDSNFPTILQPRFKKSPGTSAALFVPSVMASIWRQYSDEIGTAGPEVRLASTTAERPIVSPNKEDYAAPISSFRGRGIPLNKGKNAKPATTTSLSASMKRKSVRSGGGGGSASTSGTAQQRGRRTHAGQNHDMAGGRLARWHSLLKCVLTGLKKRSSPVELQDMSSYPTAADPCPRPTRHDPEETAGNPHGEVTFFHYNEDGTEYTRTRVPIVTSDPRPQTARPPRGRPRRKRLSCASSDSMVIVEYAGSEGEDEDEEEVDERVIETVLIQEWDHDRCECTRVSSSDNSSVNDGCSVDAGCCSFVDRSLDREFPAEMAVPNGNVNGNCLEGDGADRGAPTHAPRKRRTSTIRRIPTILRDRRRKVVKFAAHQPANHRHRPVILGTDARDDGEEEEEEGEKEGRGWHGDNRKRKGKHRWRKRKVCPQEPTESAFLSDEPFEWPEGYRDVTVPPRWSAPRSDHEMRRYMRVASRYVPSVYVKLYIQVPAVTHLCELKTHLLTCVLRSFFTTTEGLFVDWVMSLQSHVYNLLYMDVARVRFRRAASGRPCRACLLLSQDATVLVRHKRCSLLSTVADLLQIAPEELLVMEKGQGDRGETPPGGSLPCTPEKLQYHDHHAHIGREHLIS